MVFSSNTFLFFFLPAALALYYLSPRRLRNGVLLLASLVFYGWGEPVYLLLMLGVIALNYLCGRLLARERSRGRSGKAVLGLCVAVNLALLGFFKYAGFLTSSLNSLLPASLRLPVISVALPIGISFYIFQSMSYTVDVYRGEIPCQRSLIDFGAYVSMFPQLIAGPIVRYKDIAAQLAERRENAADFSHGVTLFVVGLAKKVLLANRMGALWELLRVESGSASAWVCMFAYTLQIYFDFSGYSDMAIGLGKMFGFRFPKNFDYPYISASLTEFWRRWHISLGTWFRDYVYIPLGGNRCRLSRQVFNILTVWALTGLWHGASWNFVLWGLYYGLLLTAEKLFLLRRTARLPLLLRRALTLLTVSFGWVLFSFPELRELGPFVGRLFAFAPDRPEAIHAALAYLPIMAVACVAATPAPLRLWRRLDETRVQRLLLGAWLLALMLLCTASLAAQSYNPFIYFRF